MAFALIFFRFFEQQASILLVLFSLSFLQDVIAPIPLRFFTYQSRYSDTVYHIPPRGINHSYAHFQEMVEPQQAFVLKNQHIPDFITNPSMTRDPRNESKILFVTRFLTKTKYERVHLGEMDTSFHTTKAPYRLQILAPGEWQHDLFAEDVRIFAHNYELYLYYMFHLHKFCVFLAKLRYNPTTQEYYVYKHYLQLQLEDHHQNRDEKNWMAFEYCPHCEFRHGLLAPDRYHQYRKQHPEIDLEDIPSPSNEAHTPSPYHYAIQQSVLYWVYSIQPHIIVQLHDSRAELLFATEISNFTWPWGELRGGSPALPINEDSYLTFTHSNGKFDNEGIITYVTSAYLFSRHPPFQITHITPEPIMHQDFVDPNQRWTYKIMDVVTFPMGFTMDEKYFYVSYGRNDREGYILHLDREKFLKFLVPVESRVLGESELLPNRTNVVRGTFKYHRESQEGGRLPFFEKYGSKKVDSNS